MVALCLCLSFKCLALCIWIILHFLKQGFILVALTSLEFTLYLKLALNSQRLSTCLCLLSFFT